MQRIKVGNTILLRFTPNGQGVPDDLTSVSALAVELTNTDYKTPAPYTYILEGATLLVTCQAEGQQIGKHLLAITYEIGGRVRSFDGYAFELVETSSKSDAGAMITENTIELNGLTCRD